MIEEKKSKSEKPVKAKKSIKTKQYNGIVIRRFGYKGTQYQAGENFVTSDKKSYDNLINIKRIK